MLRTIVRSAIMALLVAMVVVQPVLAYIDPNTGGMLFQLLAVLFASLSAILLFFSRQIRTFVARVIRALRGRTEPQSGAAGVDSVSGPESSQHSRTSAEPSDKTL